MPIAIAIADDHLLFRKGLIRLISEFKNVDIILEAENGKILLEQLSCKQCRPPDIVLLDISMPEMNGIETYGEIRARWPSIRTIMLSMHQDEKHILLMIELGVNGYLIKSAEPEEVRTAIVTVMEKEYYFNEQVAMIMQRGLFSKKHRKAVEGALGLTQREQEVLRMICKEYTTVEIAQKLFISERTAEGHRNHLLMKTGAKNTAGLVLFAVKNYIVSF
jgi:DNA-binding NarL/FixJ family response regulator